MVDASMTAPKDRVSADFKRTLDAHGYGFHHAIVLRHSRCARKTAQPQFSAERHNFPAKFLRNCPHVLLLLPFFERQIAAFTGAGPVDTLPIDDSHENFVADAEWPLLPSDVLS